MRANDGSIRPHDHIVLWTVWPLRSVPWWLWVAVAAYACVYVALDFNKLYALRSDQNTGLYLQSAANLIHAGTTFDWPDAKPHMLVHDQWFVYAVLSPLVALQARPETIIVVQVVSLAASALALYAFATVCGAGPRASAMLALAYLVAPSLQGWTYDGFVGEYFLPLPAFGLAIALRRRSLVATLACAQILLGIKEDEAWFIGWFGLLAAGFYDRRLGLAMLGLAGVNAAGYYALAHHFGATPEHPQYGLRDREPVGQATFLIEMLVPLGFAPLRLGWKLVAAAPLLGELFLTQNRSYPLFHIGSYYTVPLVVAAAIAAALVISDHPRYAQFALGGAVFMAFFFNNASVVHIGRRPFSLDPQYALARAWATTRRPVDIPCEDVGAWTVAAANPNARLIGCGEPASRVTRPAWKDGPLRSSAPWTRGPN